MCHTGGTRRPTGDNLLCPPSSHLPAPHSGRLLSLCFRFKRPKGRSRKSSDGQESATHEWGILTKAPVFWGHGARLGPCLGGVGVVRLARLERATFSSGG